MRIIVFCVTVALLLTACTERHGKVHVGQTQVFTRERLVEDRVRETQWTLAQFDKPFQPGVQGYIDERIYSGLSTAITGGYGPLQGRVEDERLRRQLEEERSQRFLNQARFERELTQIREGASSAASTPPQNIAPGSSDSDRQSNKHLLDAIQHSEIYDRTKPGSVATQVATTGLERVTDERTFRDGLTAFLHEKQLDDTHDMNGDTLYELQLDIEIEPLSDVSAPVRIEFNAVRPESPSLDLEMVYEKFIDALGRELAHEAIWYQARKDLPPEETIVMLQFLHRILLDKRDHVSKEKSNTDAKQDQIPSLEREIQEFKKDCITPLADPLKQNKEDNEKLIAKARACYVWARYNKTFSAVAEVYPPARTWIGEKYWYVSPVGRGSTEQQENFFKFISTILVKQPKVLSIEPKELVQNISDVAARENLLNLSLGLNAALPNGVSAKTLVEIINRSQTLLQNIMRQPLVVSFSDGAKFGWVVGPKLDIRNAYANYSQVRTKYPVSVFLKVPAVMDAICLGGNYSWGKNGGDNWHNPVELWATKVTNCPLNTIKVELLKDYAALIPALEGQADRSFRRPRIDPFPEGTIIRNPSSSSPQSIIISGRELWRNPRVYLGGSPAKDVKVLPNMGGLLATFDSNCLPSKEGFIDLTVVTTFGSDTVKNRIQVSEPIPQSSPSSSKPY